MTHVDLFSGIGGFALAARWTGFETVVFCEKDEFCQKVLQKRFGGFIADSTGTGCQTWEGNEMGERTTREIWQFTSCVPIIPEIRDFDGTKWRGATLLTGGFPCQPFSVAGKRKGKDDDRYLWPEMLRVIKEAKPRWILAENVAGILKMALDTVLADLESEGYATGTVVIPAAGVNAPHRRDRIWILAYSGNDKYRGGRESVRGTDEIQEENREKVCSRGISGTSEDVANTKNVGWERKDKHWKDNDLQGGGIFKHQKERRNEFRPLTRRCNKNSPDPDRINGDDARFSPGKIPFIKKAEIQRCKDWEIPWIEVATRFCRVDDGVPNRVDRLKSLGNAIVPQVAEVIMRGIAEIEEQL